MLKLNHLANNVTTISHKIYIKMKRIFITLIILAFNCTTQAQKIKTKQNNKAMTLIEDRLALKELVDIFSILADEKKTEQQTFLFTENAEVISILNGKANPALVGRKQIGEAFAGFLNLFETVYHLNGQQTVSINGNAATGTSYCQVTLIATENDKKMKTTFGIIYNDEFLKVNGHWLINKRKSNFIWTEKTALGI